MKSCFLGRVQESACVLCAKTANFFPFLFVSEHWLCSVRILDDDPSANSSDGSRYEFVASFLNETKGKSVWQEAECRRKERDASVLTRLSRNEAFGT
ncbi:hypothetical protein AVEN_248075-1 [Araneus ventricosus]|uniref:Uncharacterized protein n=1 Tax=Araneus ventricosus TaxID=182803 RepID=A0A4Y2MPF4_ARAVE|nr:hypothetical protein AVEN_248075-1 [Araneus ventricosus]